MDLSEDRATLLYLLDLYSKHLFEIDTVSVRKAREAFDGFAKSILRPHEDTEKEYFKLRQFFSSYRIDEYTYIQKTFEDFKKIIWGFADQLSEEVREEKVKDEEIEHSLDQLREAVESNSIESLRSKSKAFIDFYIRHQVMKDERRAKRMQVVKRNLNTVKKKLIEANQDMRVDHLTNAYNRKSFDEQLEHYVRLNGISKSPVSLMVMDIDHFKKVNDCYGHDIGDVVIKECVNMLKQVFVREGDFVARVGGEEFAVILPDYEAMNAAKKAEEALSRIRREALIIGKFEIRFTISIGIAQLKDNEKAESWFKRADKALYQSKHSGRDRYTIAVSSEKAA